MWQDYQNYYFNCMQDSDNNLMDILNYLTENGMLDKTIEREIGVDDGMHVKMVLKALQEKAKSA